MIVVVRIAPLIGICVRASRRPALDVRTSANPCIRAGAYACVCARTYACTDSWDLGADVAAALDVCPGSNSGSGLDISGAGGSSAGSRLNSGSACSRLSARSTCARLDTCSAGACSSRA